MVVFSSKVDYALILLREMAQTAEYFSLGKLAKEKKLPYRYISRIAGELKKAGFIESKEGVTGGYRLAKKPAEISAKDVVELFEGPIGITQCTIHPGVCPREGICSLKSTWNKMRTEVIEVISRYSLADLV